MPRLPVTSPVTSCSEAAKGLNVTHTYLRKQMAELGTASGGLAASQIDRSHIVKNGHAWTPRLIAGLGSFVLMLGILTAFQHGTPRPAAPAGIGAVALRASGASATRVATTSYAVGPSGERYCHYNGGYACLNAWGGGPWVDAYTGGPGGNDNNADFTVIPNNATGNYEIEFTGGGTWSGDCIGDAYSDPSHADTSLDSCGSTKGAAGWGTNFIEGSSGCSSGEVWFYNTHWHGYLGPPNNWVNGSHFYLNNTGYSCFSWTYIVRS